LYPHSITGHSANVGFDIVVYSAIALGGLNRQAFANGTKGIAFDDFC
jgi:hypothetical protein